MEIDMTANSFQGSAKIYQFPAGGRAGLGGHRHDTKPAEDLAALRVPRVTSGGAWYHEEAIRESEGMRKN